MRTTYLGHDVISNPPPSSGGILIAYGLALLERVARGGPGTAEALASLAEVMREQTRARGGSFARPAPTAARAAAARARDRSRPPLRESSGSLPGAAEHAPRRDDARLGRRRDGNAASLSSSTGSGSGVIVPGTGIQLNNMLGEYDLVAGGPRARAGG